MPPCPSCSLTLACFPLSKQVVKGKGEVLLRGCWFLGACGMQGRDMEGQKKGCQWAVLRVSTDKPKALRLGLLKSAGLHERGRPQPPSVTQGGVACPPTAGQSLQLGQGAKGLCSPNRPSSLRWWPRRGAGAYRPVS